MVASAHVTATTEMGAVTRAECFRMRDPMRAINVKDRLPIVALGQWIDLIKVESVVGFHARDGAFSLARSYPS